MSVLFAEAKTPNYLVGSFERPNNEHNNRRGIEEALWLLAVHRKSGRINLLPDAQQLPFSEITNVILSSHSTNSHDSYDLENAVRTLAVNLSKGSILTFTGLCKPTYTSTVLRETIEKHSGLRMSVDLGLCYLPLFWAGETIQAFREKPKIVAALTEHTRSLVQETLLRIFPSIISAPRIEAAEAAGLFATVYREVVGALELELAQISESQEIDYNEALNLCRGTGMSLLGLPRPVAGRDSIGSTIALGAAGGKGTPQLIGAAKRINEDFESHVLRMIKNALARCGRGLRRSRVAILGLDGLETNTWTKRAPGQILQALKKRGANVSIYPGETQQRAWVGLVGRDIRVETNLHKAVSEAHCAVVALDSTAGRDLDPKTLALEMSRPAAICDLTKVLEASNVERAGLFYASIGRGTMHS